MTTNGQPTDVEYLIAIEAIRQVKARYWRGVDCKDAALLRAALTPDVVTDFRGEAPAGHNDHLLMDAAEPFIAQLLAVLTGVVTVHHGHAAEIDILSATEATAIWPMQDTLWVVDDGCALPFRRLRGFGHYHDRYRLTAEGWRISYMRLDRLQMEIEPR
jgi:hypothetical protein